MVADPQGDRIRNVVVRLCHDDGEHLTRELVDAFLEATNERMTVLRTELGLGDPEEIAHVAGGLRFDAEQLGANELAHVAGQIEAMAGAGDPITAMSLLPMLESRAREARVVLVRALAERSYLEDI